MDYVTVPDLPEIAGEEFAIKRTCRPCVQLVHIAPAAVALRLRASQAAAS